MGREEYIEELHHLHQVAVDSGDFGWALRLLHLIHKARKKGTSSRVKVRDMCATEAEALANRDMD